MTKISGDRFSDTEREVNAIRHIVIGDARLSQFFLNTLSPDSAQAILKSLLSSQPPMIYQPTNSAKNIDYLQWIESQLLKKQGNTDPFEMNCDSMIIVELKQTKSKAFSTFLSNVGDYSRNPNDDAKLLALATSFLKLRKDNPAASSYFLPKFEAYFRIIPLSKVIETFMFNGFHLYSSIDAVKGVKDAQVTYTSSKDYEELFQVHSGYAACRSFSFIQNQIVEQNFYPKSPKYEVDRNYRSLLETSILKKFHFVDIVRSVSKEYFEKHNFEKSMQFARELGDVAPWLFISNDKNFVVNFRMISENLTDFGKGKSAAHEFIARLLNDIQFVGNARSFTGQILSIEDVTAKSYPLIMQDFLLRENPAPFEKFHRVPLYCISDEARAIDADFVWASFAVNSFLRVFAGHREDEDEIIGQLEWYLEQISDKGKLQEVLKDIFSLLFLKKNGKFVCRKEIAENVLIIILNLSEDMTLMKYAQAGHLHLQIGRALADGDTLDDMLVPKRQRLFDALKRNDWQIADYIASLSEDDQRFVTVFKNMQVFREGASVEYGYETAAEIGLSYEDQKDALQKAAGGSWGEEVSQLMKSRTEKSDKNLFKYTRVLKQEYYESVTSRLVHTNVDKWEVPSFPKEKTRLRMLPGFMQYLDSLISAVMHAKLATNVFDVLVMNPYATLDALLRSGKAKEAETMGKLLKKNVLDSILINSDYPVEVVRYFTQDNPVVGIASIVSSENTITNNFEAESSVIHRLLDLKLSSDDEQKKRLNAQTRLQIMGKQKKTYTANLSVDDAYFVNNEWMTEEESIMQIQKLFVEEDWDAIAELSFIVDQNRFSEIFMEKLNNENFNSMVKLANMCSISAEVSDTLDALSSIKNDVEKILPVGGALKSLICKQKYGKASLFIEKMKTKVDYEAVLLECLKTEKDRIGILSIYPSIRDKLMESLGMSEVILTDSFQNAIPVRWRTDLPPEKILTNHVVDDTKEVISLLSRFPHIDCDQAFIDYMKKTTEINVIAKLASDFVSVCRDRKSAANELSRHLECIISRHVVDSDASEVELKSVLLQAQQVIEKFAECEFTEKVVLLRSILDYMPNAVYGYNYSMTGFGRELVEICMDMDLISAVKSMHQLWKFTEFEKESTYGAYITKCCAMSVYESISNMPIPKSVHHAIMHLFSHCHAIDPRICSAYMNTFPPTPEMLSLGWHIPDEKYADFIDSCLFEDEVDISLPPCVLEYHHNRKSAVSELQEPSHWYSRIRSLVMKQRPPVPSHAQLQPLHKLFLAKAPVSLILRYHSLNGDFSAVIAMLNDIKDTEKRVSVFMNNVLEVAISHNMFAMLKRKMKGEQDLFKAIIPVAGPHLRYDVEVEFGMFREACRTSLELYSQSRSFSRALIYLDMAQEALEKETKRTDEDVQLLTGISVQRLFSAIITTKQLDGHSGLNLFGEDRVKVLMVVLLFIANEYDLSLTIIRTYNLDTREIGEKTIDALVNEDEEILLSFIGTLELKCRKNGFNDIFKEIVYAILLRLAYQLKRDEHMVPIMRKVEDYEFKSRLLLQFGLIDEAAEVALDNNLVDIMAVIAHTGQRNITKNVAKCMKILESLS